MKSNSPREGAAPERTFERLTLNERIQHGVLVFSFTTLVVTGLPVRFSDAPWAGWLFWLMGGPQGRALLHRLAAVTMMALSVYHLGFLLGTARGRYEIRQLIPTPKDLRDMVQHMYYYLGMRREPPRFGRFAYNEKFEYLAVVWGTIIMAGTGLMLWFEVQTMLLFPKWTLDICRIIHGYEALLAALAIIISHLYNVHLKPGVFPMSRVWLDGQITETQMKHHHPLEYEEILNGEHPPGPPAGGDAGQAAAPGNRGKGEAR